MFKTIKAAWKVWRDTDINSEKPIKTKKRTKEEIEAHIAMILKRKDAATGRGEPFIEMVTMDVDFDSLTQGSFAFEWNDIFIARLMKAGYVGSVDSDLVDQWYTNVCRNIVLETYEQNIADPKNRSADLGDGRREYK